MHVSHAGELYSLVIRTSFGNGDYLFPIQRFVHTAHDPCTFRTL